MCASAKAACCLLRCSSLWVRFLTSIHSFGRFQRVFMLFFGVVFIMPLPLGQAAFVYFREELIALMPAGVVYRPDNYPPELWRNTKSGCLKTIALFKYFWFWYDIYAGMIIWFKSISALHICLFLHLIFSKTWFSETKMKHIFDMAVCSPY